MTIKLTALAIVAAFAATSAFAADKAACCAAGGKKVANNGKMQCVSFDHMSLTADQKSKLEAWQSECMKAGCTKESKTAFMTKAKGLLSAEQYAKLKTACEKSGSKA